MIVKEPLSIQELSDIASHLYGEMVKAVADVNAGILAIDAELHADLEQDLLENGSSQESLWGFNIYPELFGTPDFIEYDSMINIRPRQDNRSRGVENPLIREQIQKLVFEKIKK